MIGAMLAGWDEILGVEQDTEHGYIQIAEARIDWWKWAMEKAHTADVDAILERFGLAEHGGMKAPDEQQAGLFEEARER